MNPLFLWFILRVLTSIFAAIISAIKPASPLETMITLLPSILAKFQWIDQIFISPWMRWDVVWYQRILTQGYAPTDGTVQFHPLFPLLAVPFAKIGVSPILSLLIITSLAGILLFYSFTKLAQIDLPSKDVNFALLLFAFAPASFILFAPYPEALFLLSSVCCIYFSRRKSWGLAGLMGGLSVLTRQQGIFLLIPMAWELWESSDHKWANILKRWWDLLALGLIPAGYAIWLMYRAFYLHDIQVNFDNFQKFIFTFFISPSSSQVVQTQQFIWPWQAVYLSLHKLFSQPDLDIWVNIITGFLFLVILAITWKKMRLSYRLYSLGIAWISFSYYTGPIHPYMGLPRHLLLAFPIFIGLSASVSKQWVRLSIVALSSAGMLFLLGLYVLNGWIP